MHSIFTQDPLQLQKLINKVVEIETADQKFIGKVYTIDPVSESYILIRKNENSNIVMDVILNSVIKAVNVLDIVPYSQENILLETFFKNEVTVINEDVIAKKEKLKNWFIKNMVPLKETNNILKLYDCIEIRPPYGIHDCLCENPIILARTQELIKSMPDEVEH